jgi:ribosomal protein L32
MAATATCITCSTVYRDRDEDGAPEIPGQRCASPDCPVWICDGECSEHFSFVCECGGRFCPEHRVELYGMSLCLSCATRQWNTCQECGAAAVEHRLEDQGGLCAPCYHRLKSTGYPKCPVCHHRFWVHRIDSGWWRCLGHVCGGIKFNPRGGGFDGIPRERPMPAAPRAILFPPGVRS